MVLSDHTNKEEIAKDGILLEPSDCSCVQAASIGLRVDKESGKER
ncbi:MAG: hypothetical protein U9Q17_02890 [Chloroflexota bacterium]|nr:hypothetical protein [Chloroflexota bacterium]